MPTQGQAGWGNLGEAIGLALGGGGSQKVYDETMLRGHRTQKALKDAQKATLEYQSMIDLEEQLEPLFGDRAGAAATVLNSGNNLYQTMQGRESMYQGDALSRAMQEIDAGRGMAAANPYLGIAQGKPQTLTKVEGNTIISPFEAMSAQTPQVSPYGAGYLENQGARVAGQNAADMVRATRPPASRSTKSGEPDLDKARKEDVKAAARDAYYQLREAARTDDRIDTYGITQGDIEYALDTQGSWTSPTGMEYRVVSQGLGDPMDADLAGAISAGVIEPPAAPAPGLPAATARGTASPAAAMSGAPVTEPKGQPSPPAGEDLSFIPRMNFETGEIGQAGDAEASQLPAQARAQLSEGKVTTFRNGQRWTLENGVPKRVN